MLRRLFFYYISALSIYPLALAEVSSPFDISSPEQSTNPPPLSSTLKPSSQAPRFSLLDLYAQASSQTRHFFAYLGPTNSGKTYQALEALKKAGDGVYLSPLRLLALEVWQKMKSEGIPCNLITGEEVIMEEGAKITSQTIETLDITKHYKVAVIDEVQMLGDSSRGGAWTHALLGTLANEIYLCGSPNAEPAIKSLVEISNESNTLNITYLERKKELVVANAPLSSETSDIPKKGTAIICFSRKEVWEWKKTLENNNRTVAVIYGNLSPEVRQEQAEMFRTGKADILVATDAIGMGLNLPLETVIFSKTTKFDGELDRSLTSSEILQVGGRAGRYGHDAPVGVVTAFDSQDLNLIKNAFKSKLPDITESDLFISPDFQHIQAIARHYKTNKLAEILKRFLSDEVQIPGFNKASLTERITIAQVLDNVEASRIDKIQAPTLEAKFTFSMVPIDTKSLENIQMIQTWYGMYLDGDKVDPSEWIDVENYFFAIDLENFRKLVTAFKWLSLRFPNFADPTSLEDVDEAGKEADAKLTLLLKPKQMAKKTHNHNAVNGMGAKSRHCPKHKSKQFKRKDNYKNSRRRG